ncbi:hypothetical protein DL98DRAFT_521922 [Cadophora sp. DSE1049]|nr:hypothetical protein DL98DRAFT_521922 [Cadophora sp. DSE1049]
MSADPRQMHYPYTTTQQARSTNSGANPHCQAATNNRVFPSSKSTLGLSCAKKRLSPLS